MYGHVHCVGYLWEYSTLEHKLGVSAVPIWESDKNLKE